jgi:1-acyl-sn-glycerol-3-phosphate acyltransferase
MVMRRITSAWVLLRSVAVTLRITLVTLWEVQRGTYRRARGDERLRWWSNRLLDFAGMHYSVVNPHAVAIEPGRPTILMSNHSSLYDIPLVFLAIDGSIRMLTKKELFRVPIWGRGMQVAEFISIDRHDHGRALADLERAKEKMESGIAVWIAPEGTRSRTGELRAFKKGGFMLALQTGATIIPIGIRGAREALPPGTFSLHPGTRAEVHIGAPIEASRYGEQMRDRLMADLRREIAQLADLDETVASRATAGARRVRA